MQLFVVSSLDDARQAVKKVVAARRSSLTAMSDAAGLARGIITRFANNNSQRNAPETDIRFSSLIKFLDFAGYEIVFRKKASLRTRVLDATREETRGQ